MQISEHDIQGALGMYNASLGQQSNEKSGRAIMARQREGDMANFHYHDNLARAIRHAGRILVDLIPKIYDTKRAVRILGVDGTAEMAQIDPEQPVAVQKIGSKSIYNLGVGEYDVSVSSGPSYTTQRQESAEAMAQLFQGNPQLMGLIGDLFFRAQDWPGADDIADRLKMTLPPEIQQAEQSKGEQSPEVQQMMQQVEQVIAQKDQLMEGAVQKIEELSAQLQQAGQEAQSKQGELAVKAAELQIKEKELQIKEGELQIKQQELSIKQYDAETKRIQAQAQAHEAEGRLELDAYTVQSATSAPAAPTEQKQDQPINITIDGQRPIQKTARATRLRGSIAKNVSSTLKIISTSQKRLLQ
jgi:hypothetical protein